MVKCFDLIRMTFLLLLLRKCDGLVFLRDFVVLMFVVAFKM